MQELSIDSFDRDIIDALTKEKFYRSGVEKSAVMSASVGGSESLGQHSECKEDIVDVAEQRSSSKSVLKAALSGAAVFGTGALVVATHGLAAPVLAKVAVAKAAAGAATGAAVGGGCCAGLIKRAKSRFSLGPGRPNVFNERFRAGNSCSNKENTQPTLRKTQNLPEL